MATVGGHYLHTPLGDTGGGNYRDFTWGRDPETLLRVVIEARWNATDAAGQELSMRANLLEGVDYFDQPMVEGPSALIIDIDLAASEARDEPRVYFESPHRTWLPASASKTLLQQNVTVSTLEYYTCDAQA